METAGEIMTITTAGGTIEILETLEIVRRTEMARIRETLETEMVRVKEVEIVRRTEMVRARETMAMKNETVRGTETMVTEETPKLMTKIMTKKKTEECEIIHRHMVAMATVGKT